MRGRLVAAVASYGHLHPDVVAHQSAALKAIYDLLRRDFQLRYPEQEEPPEMPPLGDGWLHDLHDLYCVESRAMRDAEEAARRNAANAANGGYG